MLREAARRQRTRPGAYAAIRKQFNTAIANFEGVGEALTRIAGYSYIMNSAVSVTAGAIDQGEKPAVPSAILKYHCTELGRMVANDAMDVHGGKAIMMGPKNYLGRGYMADADRHHRRRRQYPDPQPDHIRPGRDALSPVCTPRARCRGDEDIDRGLIDFDDALFGHIGYAISNLARSFFLALTHGKVQPVCR